MTAGTLHGRTAIVTGANQGLGKAIARAYVAAGANVVLCARDARQLEETATELDAISPGSAEWLRADVAVQADVAAVVARALSRFGRFEILVNNAGVYGPMGALDAVDMEDWIQALNVNLLGSVHCMRAVLPHFKARRYGKIIQISGGGAANPLPRISAYAASKAAIVRLAESVALEVREHSIDVNSIAPGALNTRLLDEVIAAGPEKVGADFYTRSSRQREQGGTPLEVPARLAVFLASAQSDGITGKLVSAVWDDWQAFPAHLRELDSSDVYTLRRIVAKDRGFGWGDK